ncbi:MAG: flagellar filament capping protein FliD [Myxococcota bacterium]
MSQVFGLVSGMDSGKLIDATVNARKGPIRAAQKRQTAVKAQISEVSSLIGKLSTLKTTLEDLEENKDVLALSATSDDEDVLTVTATGASSPGNYALDVTSLASAEKNRSESTFADKYDEITAGTISIAVDGEDAVDITVDEGDDLKTVVDKINAADVDVHASLIFDGSNFSMQIVNMSTGYTTDSADDALVITETYTGTEGTQLNMAQITQATNAEFTLDGLAIVAQDNSVADALEGVTIDLKTTGEANIVIDKDKEGTKENLQTFVDAYNEVMTIIKDQMVVEEGEDRNKKLAGEPFLGRLKADLQDIVAKEIEGLSGTFESLAMIGISTDTKSKLTIDSEELDEALDKDINGLGNVFTFEDSGITAALLEVADRYIDGDDSILEERKDAFQERVEDYTDRIEDLEERVASLRIQMTKRFTSLEQTMSALNQQSSALLGLVTGG